MGQKSISDESNRKHRIHSEHYNDDQFEKARDDQSLKKILKRKSKEFKNIESELLAMREEIIHRINLIAKDKNRQNRALTKDLDDQSIAIENDEVIDNLDNRERMQLAKIDQALIRVHEGTNGICHECGMNINKKRLMALPYATTCITCASQKKKIS